ncbi:MAG: ComEC/Rec2 family competence protein, partial [Halanaerobiaceae bacterium]
MDRPLVKAVTILISGIITAYYLFSPEIPLISQLTVIVRLISFLSVCLLFLFVYIIIFGYNYRTILVYSLIFIMGFLQVGYREITYSSPLSVTDFNGQPRVEVTGKVEEDLKSLLGNKINLRPVIIDGKRIDYGLIQLDKRYLPVDLKNGDLIKLNLSLSKPPEQMNPGGFSAYKYLKRKGVYSIGYFNGGLEYDGRLMHPVKDIVINLKYRFIKIINNNCRRPYNKLFTALLLGERDGLRDRWKNNFNLAGINHLLAISGLHVGFVLLIFLQFFKILKFPACIRDFICTLFIVIFIIITGFRPSVFRAGLLAISFLWAPYLNRKADILNIMGLTAFLNLIIDPYQLFAVGFQLTYYVLLMIIMWNKVLQKYLPTVFSVSTAAQLGSAPLTAYYFNIITPI